MLTKTLKFMLIMKKIEKIIFLLWLQEKIHEYILSLKRHPEFDFITLSYNFPIIVFYYLFWFFWFFSFINNKLVYFIITHNCLLYKSYRKSKFQWYQTNRKFPRASHISSNAWKCNQLHWTPMNVSIFVKKNCPLTGH